MLAPRRTGKGNKGIPECHHSDQGRQDRRLQENLRHHGSGFKAGNEITLTFDGEDEEAAYAAVTEFVKANL